MPLDRHRPKNYRRAWNGGRNLLKEMTMDKRKGSFIFDKLGNIVDLILSPTSSGTLGQPDKPEVTPSKPDCEYEDDFEEASEDCPRCGGEGYILESDGDPSDWMEDTYCGPDDSVIMCWRCGGTGAR